ncbi:unnamed protein product [Meganyctiphanes norvegica]|uniref:Uncharacterized protein n=1 Tax=Meganyctiphanes norvegica TaxID=48144 RepID=A0AAV2RAC0_MEGNR
MQNRPSSAMARLAILLTLITGSALATNLPPPVYLGEISENFVQKAVQNEDGSRLYQDEISGRGSLICRPPFSKDQILCEGLAGQGDFLCKVQPDRSAYDCQGVAGQGSFSCNRIQSADGELNFDCQGAGNFGPRGLPNFQGDISETFVQKAVQNEDGSRLYQDETSGRGNLICRPPFGKQGLLCNGLAGQGDFICNVASDRSAYNCIGTVGQGSFSCNRIQDGSADLSFTCEGTGNFGPQALPSYQGEVSEAFIQTAVQNSDGSRLYQDETSGRGSLICRPPFGKDSILCNGLAGQGDFLCKVKSDRSAYDCQGTSNQGSFSCQRIESSSGDLTFECQGSGNFASSPRAPQVYRQPPPTRSYTPQVYRQPPPTRSYTPSVLIHQASYTTPQRPRFRNYVSINQSFQ